MDPTLTAFGIVALGLAVAFAAYRMRQPPRRATAQLSVEDRNVAFARQLYPAPPDAPPALDLEALHVNYIRKRKTEEELAEIRRRLDAHAGLVPTPQAPNSQ